MKEHLKEEDIQWLAQIIARIPALTIPSDTVARLNAHELITETPDGWNATINGILTVVNWGSAG